MNFKLFFKEIHEIIYPTCDFCGSNKVTHISGHCAFKILGYYPWNETEKITRECRMWIFKLKQKYEHKN